MTIATATQKENVALGYGNAVGAFSLHTADPGTTGANEVVGGTYVRVVPTMTPGTVDGTVVLSATIPCTSGTNVTHVGMQTATSGGTFLDKFAGAATSTGSIAVSITVAAV